MTTTVAISNIKELEQIKTLQISVISPETKAEAEVYLIKIDKFSKQLTADVKTLKAPYKAEIERIDLSIKPYQEMLLERKGAFGRAILEYNRKVDEQIRIANAKAMEKYEKKVERLEGKAIEQGKSMPIVLPPVMATAQPKTVQTDAGKLTTVKRKAWRLPLECGDPETLTAADSQARGFSIPLDFFILDTAKVGRIVRSGGTIPGVEVYEEESLSVRS